MSSKKAQQTAYSALDNTAKEFFNAARHLRIQLLLDDQNPTEDAAYQEAEQQLFAIIPKTMHVPIKAYLVQQAMDGELDAAIKELTVPVEQIKTYDQLSSEQKGLFSTTMDIRVQHLRQHAHPEKHEDYTAAKQALLSTLDDPDELELIEKYLEGPEAIAQILKLPAASISQVSATERMLAQNNTPEKE